MSRTTAHAGYDQSYSSSFSFSYRKLFNVTQLWTGWEFTNKLQFLIIVTRSSSCDFLTFVANHFFVCVLSLSDAQNSSKTVLICVWQVCIRKRRFTRAKAPPGKRNYGLWERKWQVWSENPRSQRFSMSYPWKRGCGFGSSVYDLLIYKVSSINCFY